MESLGKYISAPEPHMEKLMMVKTPNNLTTFLLAIAEFLVYRFQLNCQQ